MDSSRSSSAPPRPRGRRDRPRRPTRAATLKTSAAMRVEILKCAACAFRRLGYHGATVEEIASALHMKKGNLYYYFRNKEEILFACHQYSLDRLLPIVEKIERSALVPDEKLRRIVIASVHTILDELHGTALFLDLEALSPSHLKAVIARRDEFDQSIRRILKDGIDAARFAAGDAKLLSFAILGAINWIPRWYHPDGPSSSQEIAERFADYLVAGLKRA